MAETPDTGVACDSASHSAPYVGHPQSQINDNWRPLGAVAQDLADAAALRREKRDGAGAATTPEDLVALYWRIGHGEEGEGAPSARWIADAACMTEAEVRRHLTTIEGEVLE